MGIFDSKTLTVVIPTQAGREEFLKRAIDSIHQQSLQGVDVTIRIGIDRDAPVPRIWETQVYRGNASQASAMNACCRDLESDYLAFLEDDDRWHPHRMEYALKDLESADFVSCTQLEMADETVVRINDFPTPSGWVMKRSTWNVVGTFDEDLRYHLDNDWLGRLNESKLRRIHQTESTAPFNADLCAQVRPWLAQVARHAALQRTNLMVPLVKRAVHPQQNMANLDARISAHEYNALKGKYGEIPW